MEEMLKELEKETNDFFKEADKFIEKQKEIQQELKQYKVTDKLQTFMRVDLEQDVKRLINEKNKLINYIAIKEDMDYEDVCEKFNIEGE